MNSPQQYKPGPAGGAEIIKDGDDWTLAFVRKLCHSPEKVWAAITEPEQLREWAPFDSNGSLGVAGATVSLSTIGTPQPHVTETIILRAECPRLLEYKWGGNDIRWELQPEAEGTKLSLWTKIDRRYIAMGAAGWHICLDVLERLLEGHPVGRIVGPSAMGFDGWKHLHKEYAQQFGVELPSW
jgi:uncharacterized protein YndB with AHSA1/START domain